MTLIIKSLSEIKDRAFNLLSTYELVDKGWTFEFDNAKRRFGSCQSRTKTITMSIELARLNFKTNPERILTNIKHEIAHALVREQFGHYDKYGRRIKPHGKEWQDMCRYVGIDPQRCYDASTVESPKGKYTYKCIHCGHEVFAHRMWKRTKACTDCCNKYNNGKFSRDYLLVLQGGFEVKQKELKIKSRPTKRGRDSFDLNRWLGF